MEVLLLQDIPGIGKKDDLLIVGDGYAMNNLLPHRKALVATPTVRKRYADQIRRRAEEKEIEKKVEAGKADAVSGKEISFERKVTKTGKLYAAISEKHICEELKKAHKIDIPESSVIIAEPIKATGEFAVELKIGDTPQGLTVKVTEIKE